MATQAARLPVFGPVDIAAFAIDELADFRLRTGRHAVVLRTVGHRDRGGFFRDPRCCTESFAGACDVHELLSKRGDWSGARSDRGGCRRCACIYREGGAGAASCVDRGGGLSHCPCRSLRGAVHFPSAQRHHDIRDEVRMSNRAEAFEHWIRTSFVQMNTELENLYFAKADRAQVIGCGDPIKASLRDEGHTHVVALLAEGNTGEGFDSAYGVLGSVGLYLGALRRHELTNPAREERSPFPEASSLALHVGASLGMAPRFSTGHLATHNRARAGVRKSFTSLRDEFLFIDENTRGILSLQRAADALASIVHLGVSSPVADIMFDAAKQALRDVIRFNGRLMNQLGVERVVYSVRPYYKPYRVGRQEYRGANAGDFSGINEIDLLLGLCRANDPYYAQLLVDKMLFMIPADQARLRDCMTRTSLLDELLALIDTHAQEEWFQRNAAAYLEVCDLFGQSAAQHHDDLVKRFIAVPAAALEARDLEGITASGPPLPVLLRSLEVLRDLRLAADRTDIASRHADLKRLRAVVAGDRPLAAA